MYPQRNLKDQIFETNTYRKIEGVNSRIHAKELDRRFGYKIPKIEEKLNQKYRPYYQESDKSNRKKHFEGTQTWIGLHPQVLQTPYNDIFECLLTLQDESIKTVVDIGSGYGRVGMVMNSLFPKAHFLGYEILKKREIEGNRIFQKFNLTNCVIKNEDVLADNFKLPEAQVYFIYDFSEMSDICKILDMLVERISDYKFFLIARGDRMEYLINKKYKVFWLTYGFVTIGDLKIYRSR